ncbi:unnamed protein product [Euphydryas editha]|uniref:Cathepsin L n=1 Tax=Euphydryas editha TaxID=104508 RepID=A0AAU9TG51_EUPED|nr:unnamed protein product [Euphydryas editha]
MKILIVLLTVLVAVNTRDLFKDIQEEWDNFKLEHDKSYESAEEERNRMMMFLVNKYRVYKHNQLFERGQVTFRLGLNKYSDMSHEEFVRTMNGFKNTANEHLDKHGATFIPPANVVVPQHVDWRSEGAVTGVKDQGKCGSCWAFSATGALEGQHFRKTQSLVWLSEQNLIDCTLSYNNSGCTRGFMNNAFMYIRENGGIDTETTYPYEAVVNKCRYDPNNAATSDVGFVNILKGDEEELKQVVATVGPVSVAVDASQESFQLYSSGVYYDSKCSSNNQTHAMLVVGYGRDIAGGDYWIVKNSWGLSWGELGYMQLARNRNNHCGIASSASYPLV